MRIPPSKVSRCPRECTAGAFSLSGKASASACGVRESENERRGAPAPETNASIFPPVCSHISGPVPSKWALKLLSFYKSGGVISSSLMRHMVKTTYFKLICEADDAPRWLMARISSCQSRNLTYNPLAEFCFIAVDDSRFSLTNTSVCPSFRAWLCTTLSSPMKAAARARARFCEGKVDRQSV